MMGMKKRMKKGGSAKKKRVKKAVGGVAKGRKVTRISPKPKNRVPDAIADNRKNRVPDAIADTSKAKVVKNKGKAVINKNPRTGKTTKVTFGGANKGGKKSREGRMGGGMMKKRMKRGGRAK